MKGSCNRNTRIILHIDMDHFFSACEEREHPELKGNPVVVGAEPKQGRGRGVVKTCNYEAREFGIQSGMPISTAWRLCPNAIYVRGNYRLYKKVSERIMAILKKYSERFQRWGLDEAFLDVSLMTKDFEEATKLAESIKHEILWNEGITCSIGIGPNKLIAKIASGHEKPDGMTVVREDDVERFLAPLPVQRIVGIGEKTTAKLHGMGIKTIGDLAAFSASILAQKFGAMGMRYHRYALGLSESDVGERRGIRKSIGHECTFAVDTDARDVVSRRLVDICCKVYQRATEKNLLFKTVTVKVRYKNFRTFTHSRTLSFFTNSSQNLRKTAEELAQDALSGMEKVRLLGVRVSNLKLAKGQRILI